MNPITSIKDIQNALAGDTSHEALVGIAAFATTHLQEISKLESAQKNELFSKLVTETYDNEELETVTTLAEQFFKEKLGESFDRQGLSHLSQTEKLHLFRYVNQSKLSTSHASSLTKMSKRKRERIIYRAMLTPLLRERVQGKELEESIRKCTSFLQSLPESKKEEHIHLFKKYLPHLPAIKGHFEEVLRFLPTKADKLHHLEKVGHKLTDLSTLRRFFWKKDENDLVNQEMLLDTFPDLDLRNDFFKILPVGGGFIRFFSFDHTLPGDFTPICNLVQEIPSLSQCRTVKELNEIAALSTMPTKSIKNFGLLLQRFLQTFPKLSSGHGHLLCEAIKLGDDIVVQALERLNQEPFINITSGEKLAFIIEKMFAIDADIKLLKRFCIAFPKIQDNFEELYNLFNATPDEGKNRLLDAIEKYQIGDLPVTDGSEMSKIIKPAFNGLVSYDQFQTHFQRLRTCIDAFPTITDFGQLSLQLSTFTDSQRKTLNTILSHSRGLSFEKADDLFFFLTTLEGINPFDLFFYWGGEASLLDCFKEDVVDAFPLAKGNPSYKLESYSQNPEVWHFMKDREPFTKETSGTMLATFANFFRLDQYKNEEQRKHVLDLLQHLLSTFHVDVDLIDSLKELRNGEDLLTLITKMAPDAAFYFEDYHYKLPRTLNALNPIDDEMRAQHLRLFQRHLQNSQDRSLPELISIPAEAQESILNLLDGIDFLDEVKDYVSLVKNLSKLNLEEREALFAKNGKFQTYLSSLQTKQNKADFLQSFTKFSSREQSSILSNFEILLELIDSSDLRIDDTLLSRLALIPPSLLSSLTPQEKTVEGVYQELAKPENREIISEHLISLLNEAASDLKSLVNMLNQVEKINHEMRLGDEESPLGQTIIQYGALLTDPGEVNAWTIYQDHKKRLASDEKLPLPLLGDINGAPMLFDYEKLQSVSATADKLPKGVDFAKLQELTKAFQGRFNGLDEPRKQAIRSYLKETLPNFETIDDLVKTMNQPWWEYNLRAPDSGPVTQTSWKLFNAVAYIAQEDNEASMTLPGVEDTPENFELKEKLLSSQERALLMLLGQVQYCDSGKEGGLEQFVALQPGVNALSGAVQEGISEAIRTYLQREVIGSNAFLEGLIGDGTSQPYHDAQYIRNVLSKELKFPLKFDAHTGTISKPLFEKTPEELMTAVFAHVKLPRLYEVICNQVNAFDWKSQEGTELYKNLQGRVPPNELLSCCKFDEDFNFIGITEKAVPYVLVQYGFFLKQEN